MQVNELKVHVTIYSPCEDFLFSMKYTFDSEFSNAKKTAVFPFDCYNHYSVEWPS